LRAIGAIPNPAPAPKKPVPDLKLAELQIKAQPTITLVSAEGTK